MLLSPSEVCGVEMPSRYTDPALEDPEALLQLASRLYDAGMIRGVERARARVGLFTVVKKVVDGVITLRLILDARQSNACWRRPPWTGLGGPSALAWVDFGPVWIEGQSSLTVAAGDIPDCYHRMLLPPGFAELFVLDGVSPASLCAFRARRGLGCELRGEFVGYQVAPMGWSWAVFMAETCMRDQNQRGGHGLFSESLSLVEGSKSPALLPDATLEGTSSPCIVNQDGSWPAPPKPSVGLRSASSPAHPRRPEPF